MQVAISLCYYPLSVYSRVMLMPMNIRDRGGRHRARPWKTYIASICIHICMYVHIDATS